MGFHESRFPLRISYGSNGGPGFSTSAIDSASGQSERVGRWVSPRYTYDVSLGIRNRDEMGDVLRFYVARGGIENGFRYFDPLDHTTAANGRDAPTASDVLIGTGDGSTTTFQLFKVYTEGSESRTRNITKPIHAETLGVPVSTTYNVLVALGGTPTASGWSVDTTTGVITFSTAPGAGVAVTAGFAFDVPVEFGPGVDEALSARHDDFDIVSLDSIPLLEQRDPSAVYEEMNYGGSINHGVVAADFSINTLQGRVHLWSDNAGINVRLPAEANTPIGGPLFFLYNGGTSTTTIQDSTGTSTLGTLPSLGFAQVLLGVTSIGSRVWIIA